MSDKSAVNITVRFRQPLWSTDTFEHTESGVDAYNHVIAVDGGFKTASVSFATTRDDIDEWLEKGLARHVDVFGPGGVKIWEGIVNEVSGSIGTLNITRGPLMGICNRASVVYTPYIDVCIDPPSTGTATETTIAEDEASQERYGILEDIVSGGTLMDDATHCSCDDDPGCVPDNEAEEVRNTYLEDNKYPETNETINIDQSSTPKLTINCVGYHEFFKKYIYNCDELGTITIPAKFHEILEADPNAIFSTNMGYISDDAAYLLLVPQYEDQNRTAEAIINDMLAQGDANDNRTIFGIYENRVPYYSAIPTAVEYYHRITARKSEMVTPNDVVVDPWSIRPGKWVLLTDFMIGKPMATTMREDPRNLFIESVTYTMPFGLSIQGSKVGKVKQLMAKYGTRT